MPAVKFKGTVSKNESENNGLEEIANSLVKNEFARHVVVGIVELHKVTKDPGEPPIPTVRFFAVEPVDGDDEITVKQLLDKARKQRGLGNIADTLFDSKPSDFDFDGPATGRTEIEGQMELSTGETRMGPDGEHEVPPPSAEEIAAELAEAKAAGVPAAEFSGTDK